MQNEFRSTMDFGNAIVS